MNVLNWISAKCGNLDHSKSSDQSWAVSPIYSVYLLNQMQILILAELGWTLLSICPVLGIECKFWFFHLYVLSLGSIVLKNIFLVLFWSLNCYFSLSLSAFLVVVLLNWSNIIFMLVDGFWLSVECIAYRPNLKGQFFQEKGKNSVSPWIKQFHIIFLLSIGFCKFDHIGSACFF